MTVRTVRFGGTDWADGTVLSAADLNDTFGKVSHIDLGGGTITVATDTTTADTDYFDISIAAGDMGVGDRLVIEAQGFVEGNQNLNFNFDINGTTLTGTLNADTVNSGQHFQYLSKIMTNTLANDMLSLYTNRSSTATLSTEINTFDTNDANVLTTAFSVRLNAYHVASSSTATIIRVWAYILKA